MACIQISRLPYYTRRIIVVIGLGFRPGDNCEDSSIYP